MRIKTDTRTLKRALLGATAIALTGTPAALGAQTPRPTEAVDAPSILVRHEFNPNLPPPAGPLDSAVNITGIGQVVVDQGGGFVGTCTGSLINPRVVIFASHCVNNSGNLAAPPTPGSAYGSPTGGIPISVGFSFNNLPALRQWLGLDGGVLHATNEALALYNVEQVWYDPRAVATVNGRRFLEADVALATLDTPAFNVPTWALLFSPLSGQEHASIVGYGQTGTGITGAPGVGNLSWRRRAAENIVSVLGSLDDRNDFLFGAPAGLPQTTYQLSFNDPRGGYDPGNPDPALRRFDFGIFGGTALPNEGNTAPGDSGGPLIIDQKWDRKVIAGVLSGGSTYFANQPRSSYGTSNIYQPLFLFWDAIVQNNSYVYATNKAGDRDWTDASHWVQSMDPNYTVERGGALVNDLPDTPALGVTGLTPKFGQVCFLGECVDLADDAENVPPATGSGKGLVVAGGPGSENFVPNNVRANPQAGIRSRYYDVTLAAPGTTTLRSNVTIDRFAMDGKTKLDIRTGSNLTVLGTYSQITGWTNVDGRLQTGGDLLVASGLLSGRGTIRAPFVTVAAGVVAPGGGDSIGTLTVDGDMILSSGAGLLVDAQRGGADRLTVTGVLSLSDGSAPGASVVFSKVTGGPAPRHGESYVIASAAGGVEGTFGKVYSFQGVLRPELAYTADSVSATLRAGSLAVHLGKDDPTAKAFASALDTLRNGSYAALYNLYGQVDLMDPSTLALTLNGLSPARVTGDAIALQDRQSRSLLANVGDRLSMLGQHNALGTVSFTGSLAPIGLAIAGQPVATTGAAAYGLAPGMNREAALPEGMSGFVAGSVIGGARAANNRSGFAGRQSWQVGMGLEVALTDSFTLGTAFGMAEGFAQASTGFARADSRLTQATVYGAYQFGGGVYGGFMLANEQSRAGLERSTEMTGMRMFGAGRMARTTASVEAGVNLGVARGLAFTPRVALGYNALRLNGYREQGGEAALQVNDLDLERIEARVGARLAGEISPAKGWKLVPQFQADYVHGLSNPNSALTVRFAAAPDAAIVLPFANGDRGWGEIRGGMKLVGERVSFGAGVESFIGRSGFDDNRAMLDFAVRF
jgi:subtilase-type serine protease